MSRDPSLDSHDLYLGQFKREGILALGDSYESTVDVRLPDGIEGDFYILVFADSAAYAYNHVQSDIGFGLPGLAFSEPHELPAGDRVSEAQRLLARGAVGEFQEEGNNISTAALSVTLAIPPDLQVTSLAVPVRTPRGQPFQMTYTVSNLGGAIPETQQAWDDLIYLSRDEFLDLRADRYLGLVRHTDGLGSGQSYTIETSFRSRRICSVPTTLLSSPTPFATRRLEVFSSTMPNEIMIGPATCP